VLNVKFALFTSSKKHCNYKALRLFIQKSTVVQFETKLNSEEIPASAAPDTTPPTQSQVITSDANHPLAYAADSSDTLPSETTSSQIGTKLNSEATPANVAPDTTPPTQPKIVPPDAEINTAQRNIYGYTRPELLPLRKKRALALFLRGLPIYRLHGDNTEEMIFYETEIEKHDGIFGIPAAQWQNSREHLAITSGNPDAIAESQFIHDSDDTYAVFQLNAQAPETTPYRFKTYEALMIGGLTIDRGNYRLMYKAALPPKPSDTPEGIFMWVNAEKLEGYNARNIAVGDILSIKKDGEISSYYVNGRTFRELISFLGVERKISSPSGTSEGESATAASVAPATPPSSAPPPKPNTSSGGVASEPLTIPQLPPQLFVVPVFRETYAEAKKRAEEYGQSMEMYEQAAAVDLLCAQAIDLAIAESKKDKDSAKRALYDLKTASEIILETYGRMRTEWVLAITVINNPLSHSKPVVAWAEKILEATCLDEDGNISIPGEPPLFRITTKKPLLDGFINRVKAERKRTFTERMESAKNKTQEQ